MTALAAVIVLSSTPLFAQTVESPAAPDAPVIAAPPPPEVSAPAASLAAPAPEAAPVVTAPAEPVAAMRTQSTPIVHTGDDEVAASTPARTRSATPAPIRTVTASTKTVMTAPAAPAPAAAVPLAATPTPAPLPVESAAVEPAPAAAQTVTTRTTNIDETAEIGALAAVGLLAAGGLAYGLSRRRRREDEIVEETVYETETAPATVYDTPFDVTTASPLSAPAMPVPAAAPAVAAAGPSRLANGFDLSRFGPHAQAAYRGPTPENPSFSLRRRLHRASFFDQRAREAAEAGIAPPIPTPIAAANGDDQIVVRVGKQRPSRLFGGFATQR
jgi:hypothetical protein